MSSIYDYEEQERPPSVPYIVHEGAMAREERTIKRLWILCIIMFVALVVTNAGWMYYENQFIDVVDESIETSTEGGGNAYGTIVSGNRSSVTYGEDKGDKD